MTALIKANWQRLLTVVLLLLLMGSCYRLGRIDERDSWEVKWAGRDVADAKALAQREVAERTEEQRRQQVITRITENAQQQITAARADASSAAVAGDRLQQTVRQLQRRLHESEASGNTSTARRGKATSRQCSVLTDLFIESVERNQQLAAEADRRRIAGLACERAYDALIK